MTEVRIPHAAPVRLLGARIDQRDGWWCADACIAADAPAVAGGLVRAEWLIELAAQAAAAVDGAGSGGPARSGMLIGVKDWHWLAAVPAHASLRVRVRPLAALGALAQFAAEIERDGATVARGELQVHRA
jgi:predicted hotdog family 3-hydroxylacyl-ACP dehydratase